MGREKFYRTPEGLTRAELLAASGVRYSARSVEFSLVAEHTLSKTAGRLALTGWACRLGLSALDALLLTANANQGQAMELRSSLRASLNKALDRLTPECFMPAKPAPDAESGARRYAEALGSKGGFGSLDEIVGAVSALNDAVTEKD